MLKNKDEVNATLHKKIQRLKEKLLKLGIVYEIIDQHDLDLRLENYTNILDEKINTAEKNQDLELLMDLEELKSLTTSYIIYTRIDKNNDTVERGAYVADTFIPSKISNTNEIKLFLIEYLENLLHNETQEKLF